MADRSKIPANRIDGLDEKLNSVVDTADKAATAATEANTKATEALTSATEAKTLATSLNTEITTIKTDVADLGDQVHEIEAKIPSEASDSNQLADKAFVNDKIAAINFIKWVTELPATGETKYLYAIARTEKDKEGHYIAALYVWDGSEWRGAGGYSLNIDPDTIATKTYVTNITDGLSAEIATNTTDIAKNAGDIAALDADKQDVISDLDTIRAGAAKGATALQSYTETDPTVPSYVKSITEANIASWNAKQPAGDYATTDALKTVSDNVAGLDTRLTTAEGTIETQATEIATNAADIAALDADKQDKLTAGTNITIKDNVISSTTDVSGYLPLTGGTMTGNITFDKTQGAGVAFETSSSQSTITGAADGRILISPASGGYIDVSGQGIRNANSGKWYLDESKIGVANGVAGLDSNSLVPTNNIPIDGTSITVNTEGKLSASGGSGGSGFDFEGTKAEFDAAVTSGTITDDSVSLITDDVSGDTVATKAELAAVDASKANTALSNVLENIDYVVERKVPTPDDPTWYRVYKSGWVEQGGEFTTTATTTSTSYVVNLKKEMVNTAYYVSVRPINASGYFQDDWTVVGARATTNFKTSTPAGSCVWYVCGQGAN